MDKPCNSRSQWGRCLIEEIEGTGMERGIILWFLGGPSICLRTKTTIIYIDLYTGPSVDEVHRMCAIPLDPYDVAKCDALISTHHHVDHCEKESLFPIWQRTNCSLIGPSSSAKLMREWGISDKNVIVLSRGENFILADLKITALVANDCEDKEAISYIFETQGVTIFAGGDTRYFEEMSAIGNSHNIDISLLSFGRNPSDQDIFMGVRDVIKAAEALHTKILIPIHWDLWKEYWEDPEKVVRCARRVKAKTEVRILRLGDRLKYEKH